MSKAALEFEENEVATAIAEISAAMKKLMSTRLTEKAIITLVHARSGVGKGDIESVMHNLVYLEDVWLKKKPLKSFEELREQARGKQK